MKLEGNVDIQAPRERVWAYFLDPEQVRGCLPWVQSIERQAEGRFVAKVKVGTGLFSVTVPVSIAYARTDPPNGMTITLDGAAHGSTVVASADVVLRDTPTGGTTVAWIADAEISGALASLAPRFMGGPADAALGETFGCIRRTLEA